MILRLAKRLDQEFRHRVSLITTPKAQSRIIHTHVNGYGLLVRANEDVGRAIHFERSFETLETTFLASGIGRDSVCFDVGANVGYFSMLMAQRAPEGQIHAFEPLPLNAALLRASAELNGFKNVTVNQTAVGAEDGHVEFVQSADSAYSSMRDTSRKLVDSVLRVPIVRLDSYCASAGIDHIDVLKVDVEGAEGLVVEGGERIFGNERSRPRLMMIELQDSSQRIFGSSVAEIVGVLRKYGYSVHVLDRDGTLMTYDHTIHGQYYNLIFRAGA